MNLGKNSMNLETLANKMLLDPVDNFKNLLPHYENMLSTGIVDDVLFQQLKPSNYGFPKNFNSHLFAMILREDYIKDYGYTLLSEKMLNTLGKILKGKKILEAGSGSGFLSYSLQNLGLDITPVDFKNVEDNPYSFSQSYTNILNEDAVKHLQFANKLSQSYDIVIMSWPCLGTDFANNILNAMKPGQKLIYIGERGGGCTANDKFFNSLEDKTCLDQKMTDKLQENSLSFTGLHDDWYVYEIN